jgi:hypothetical protein
MGCYSAVYALQEYLIKVFQTIYRFFYGIFIWREVRAGYYEVIAGNRNNGVGTSGWVDGKPAVEACCSCFKRFIFSCKWMVWYPIVCRI